MEGTARDPRGQRPGPVHLPRRAALLAAVGAPVRALGAQHLRRHRAARCRPGSTLDHPGVPVVRTARSCRPRRCRRSTRTRSRPRCTTSPGWPSTGSTSTTTSSSAGRSGPRRCSARPGLSSVFFAQSTIGLTRPARLAAVAQGRVEQPPAAPGGLRRGHDQRAGARAVRRPHLGARARSSSGSPTWSARPRASPFRSDTDISTLSSFAQHYGLLTGTAYAAEADTVFVNIANPDLDWQLVAAAPPRAGLLLPRRPPRPRLPPVAALDELLTTFLREYFPVARAVGEQLATRPSLQSVRQLLDLGLGLGRAWLLELLARPWRPGPCVSSSAMAADDSYRSTYSWRSASTRFIAASSSGVSTRTFIASQDRSARSTRSGATSRPSQSGLERLSPASMKSSTGWWPLRRR